MSLSIEPRFANGFVDALFGSEDVGFGLIDKNLCYIKVNETLASINGLSAADHEGRTIRDVIPQFADFAEPLLRQVMSSQEPVIALEVSGPSAVPDVDEGHYLVSYYPIREDDSVIGVGAVVVDVTERARAKRELDKQARDVYENVVQDLTVTKFALESGEMGTALEAADRGLQAAKSISSKVLLQGLEQNT
jgi:PAS domain S-box-containing protein